MTRSGEFYWHRAQVITQIHSRFHCSKIWLTELSEIVDFFSFRIQRMRFEQSWMVYMYIPIWFPLLSFSFWIIKEQKKEVQKNHNKLKQGSFHLNPSVSHEKWSIIVQGSAFHNGSCLHTSILSAFPKKKYLLETTGVSNSHLSAHRKSASNISF